MIILICGKICAGKSTYAKRLMKELPAVRLNADEIMKSLFGEHLGNRHEEIFSLTMDFIYEKALEIDSCGLHVIIDAGFWYRQTRQAARDYFAARNVKPEWHYVHVSDGLWRHNIAKRNQSALLPGSRDYFVDENILQKFLNPEDEPTWAEMDVWFENSERMDER